MDSFSKRPRRFSIVLTYIKQHLSSYALILVYLFGCFTRVPLYCKSFLEKLNYMFFNHIVLLYRAPYLFPAVLTGLISHIASILTTIFRRRYEEQTADFHHPAFKETSSYKALRGIRYTSLSCFLVCLLLSYLQVKGVFTQESTLQANQPYLLIHDLGIYEPANEYYDSTLQDKAEAIPSPFVNTWNVTENFTTSDLKYITFSQEVYQIKEPFSTELLVRALTQCPQMQSASPHYVRLSNEHFQNIYYDKQANEMIASRGDYVYRILINCSENSDLALPIKETLDAIVQKDHMISSAHK